MIGLVRKAGFNTEEMLVKAAVSYMKKSNRKDYRIDFEVDAGVGVADIVLSKRSLNSLKYMKILADFPPRMAVLLDPSVGSKINSVSELSDFLGSSLDNAKRLASKFSKMGILKYENNEIIISTIKNPPFKKIIAVEAKISHWQQVLVQAYRNLQFADESWAVLDHACVGPALNNLENFKASGVGLISIDKDNGLFVHSDAGFNGPVSLGKRWQIQAVLSERYMSI